MQNPANTFEFIRLYPERSTDPSVGRVGEIYFNTASVTPRICTNSSPLTWSPLLISPMKFSGDMVYLNSSLVPTNLPIGSNGYVLTVSGGLPVWQAPDVFGLPSFSAQAMQNANINVSSPGTSTFDSVTLTSGQLLLLTGQTTQTQNGLYTFNGSSSPLTRAPGWNSGSILPDRSFTIIDFNASAVFSNTIWAVRGDVTVDSTPFSMDEVGGSQDVANQALSNLTSPTSVNQNLLPQTDNSLTLGSSSLSWHTANVQFLLDGSGVVSAALYGRHLSDSSGSTSVDWQNGQLLFSAQKNLDWQNQLLTTGTSTVVDWGNDLLNDQSDVLALDWNNRNLTDNSAVTSVGWQSRRLLDNSSLISVNWQNRSLAYNNGTTSSVDWQNGFLFDTGGNPAVKWTSRVTEDASGDTSIDWQNRLLVANDGSTPNLNWSTPGTLALSSIATMPGSSSGLISIQTQASSGTYNFNLPTTAGSTGQVLTSQGGMTSAMTWTTPTTGTVTSLSVVSANGFAGTVANPSTTPAITVSTTVNAPVLAGNGTAVSAATTTGSGSTVVLATGPTMTNPVVGTQITTDNSTKAASTAYVTTAVANAVAGVNPAVAVQAATTAAGDTSGFTYNNGVGGIGATFTGATNTAVTIDGFTFTTLGQRLLVKNDTQSPSGAFNGVYYVTQVQTSLLPPILTRALDYDQPSDINSTGAIPVVNGTVNGTTSWLLTSAVNTVGTDPLTYTKFSINPSTILINPMTTAGDTIYENSTPAPARLPIGTAGQILTTSSGLPAWLNLDLTGAATALSGALGATHGGTGQSSLTTFNVLIGNGTSGVAFAAPTATSGVPLISQGSSSNPSFGTALVAGGGTGNTSFTAYNLIAGGTTSTGALQQMAAPTAPGQTVQSGASSTVPIWTTPAAFKNYLKVYTASTSSGVANTGNGDFELGATTGFSLGTIGTLTNGLPTGTPTFGSGASGNLSISTVTSGSQIGGTYSLSYASSAATTQGNMVASSAFFIDSEDQAKILNIRMYYTVASGAANTNFSGTSSNSFGWAAWDVTNSAWLTSAGNFNFTQTSGTGFATGTVQTAINTSQIRLCFYNVNATSGAATIYLDDLFVGPIAPGQGIIPQAATTTVLTSGTAATYTTPANVVYIEVEMVGGGGGGGGSGTGSGGGQTGTNTTFSGGSVSMTADGGNGGPASPSGGFAGGAGGNASGGDVNLTGGSGQNPPGNTSPAVDQTYGAGGGCSYFAGGGQGGVNGTGATGGVGAANTGGGGGGVGAGSSIPGSAGGGSGGYCRKIISSPAASYTYTVGGGAAGGTSGTGGGTGGAGGSGIIIVHEYYKGLNVQMSADTDTRVVAFSAITSSSQSVPSSAGTITFGTPLTDTHGAYNGTTTYTIPVTGIYDLTVNGYVNPSASTGGTTSVNIQKNGANIGPGASTGNPSAGQNYTISLVINGQSLKAGDTILVQMSQNNGSGTETFNGYFSVMRRSGPAVIAATESVNMSYQNTAGSTVPTSLGTIPFATKFWDTHNEFNGSTGVYTVPVSGKYRMSANLLWSVTISTTQNVIITGNQTGSASVTKYGSYLPGTGANSTYGLVFTETFNCLAGDSLFIQAQSAVSATLNTTPGTNTISIERIGQ